MSYPASKVAHWVTGPINVCDEHARQIVKLGNLMGTHVAVTALVANTLTHEHPQCINCINNPNDEVTE